MPSSKSIVLVPSSGAIESGCEMSLTELEKRGYVVRRIFGYSAIDFGRCEMASQALSEGFDDLIWIDSDINFHPDDIEKLRAHQLPFVCGIYPKKNGKAFACSFNPATEEYQVEFGKSGGLCEINYAGFGFVFTRRALYDTMREKLQLPECNARFGRPVVPYFMPMLVAEPRGYWYLSEDFAFCERAKRSGFKIMADTTIFLYHVGNYGFTWHDIKNWERHQAERKRQRQEADKNRTHLE